MNSLPSPPSVKGVTLLGALTPRGWDRKERRRDFPFCTSKEETTEKPKEKPEDKK